MSATPRPPAGNTRYIVPKNPASLHSGNPPGGITVSGSGYTHPPTVTVSGGTGPGAVVKPATEPHTANIPLDPAVVAGITSEVIIALDIGEYGKRMLLCKTSHHNGRSLYVVTHDEETITTTAFMDDAVKQYNTIGDRKS